MASQHGHAEIVKALLDKGANANAERNDGGTALMAAAENGHKEVVEALLANGADVNASVTTGGCVIGYEFGKGTITEPATTIAALKANSNGYAAVAELLRRHGGHE